MTKKEQRRAGVQLVVMQFFIGANLSWSQQEQRVLEAAQQAKQQAKPSMIGRSSLFLSLTSAERESEQAPLLPLGGGELRSMKHLSYGAIEE